MPPPSNADYKCPARLGFAVPSAPMRIRYPSGGNWHSVAVVVLRQARIGREDVDAIHGNDVAALEAAVRRDECRHVRRVAAPPRDDVHRTE